MSIVSNQDYIDQNVSLVLEEISLKFYRDAQGIVLILESPK